MHTIKLKIVQTLVSCTPWTRHTKRSIDTFYFLDTKDVMQGKLFQKSTHLLYCSVQSLGGNVNKRRMSKPDIGSIFHIKKSMKYSGHRKHMNYQNYQNLMLLTSSEFGYETNTDDASILVYKFRLKRTGFNMYAEYTRPQLTFLALHSWVLLNPR